MMVSSKNQLVKLGEQIKQKLLFFSWSKSSFPLHCRKRKSSHSTFLVFHYRATLHMHTSATSLKPWVVVYDSVVKFITGEIYSTHHFAL